ncbi:MAG: VCBS repeat-containing protein, partial [Cyclobacteriaceae bacterium]|nr:VCBS repeat-containing protein [Cyclobacteriaceae bacterium]
MNAAPVAANILGDSKLELICGPIIYTVPSLASRTLQTLTVAKDMNTLGVTYFPKGFNDTGEYGVDQASSTSTADFNGDGKLDVLMSGAINCSGNEAAPCGNPITTIFYWDVTNNTVQTYAPPDLVTPATGWAWGTGRINLGDATGDGKLDALFIAGNRLFCLSLDGGGLLTVKWIRTINDSQSGIVSLTVYDFDNNGKPEVVYRDAKELTVVDGQTGATKIWSASCESHTFTEGPVVADVNGDGNTDICVPCYTNPPIGSNTVQQQSLGQTRIYYSSSNAWLPTRKVWNQHPYYVTNINDDLTVPRTQIDPSLIFSNGACPNGLPGPQRPLNLFMNQVPRLSASGCPEFPAPDLTFTGDDPANPGVDSDGDGVYTPAVEIIPPICGDVAIKAFFNVINSGSLPITDNVPVSFFNGDPTQPGAVRLFNTTLTINNLQVGQKLVTPQVTFNGPGTVFPLFIVLYNDGSTLPITLTGPSQKECSISNNMYSVIVAPDPFTVTVEKVSDNIKCGPNVPPYSGEIRARIFKGGVEVVDYSPFSFQWYDGIGTATPHNPGGNTYHLTNVIDGDYTVVVTNTQKGCASDPISGNVGLSQINPAITLTVTSNQTVCSPPNGRIDATIAGDNTGYTFEWYDIALTPLGITGPTATNLLAGNYVVVVTKNGCSTTSAPATVNGPVIPDAQASVTSHVVDCLNPNSGAITGEAVLGGVPQNPANYTFDWYFYNNATSTRGSALPPANGTGPSRTGLAIGYYQLEIRDVTTQCVGNQSPIVQVLDQRVLPTVAINQVAPQTSCDPLNPNGILTAVASAPGLTSPNDFTFEWFKGDNTLPANLHTNVSGAKGETANVVSGGGVFYTVRATTPSNCSATEKLIIAEVLNLPVVSLTMTNNTTCSTVLGSADFDGTITATATFAGSPINDFTGYKFTWHDGSLTSDPTIPVADDKLPSLSQLDGGNYTVTLELVNLACKSIPVTINVVNAFILPNMVLTPTGSTNCVPGKEDGSATVTTVDGLPGNSPGYTFAWTGPAAPAFPVSPAANNSNTTTLIKLQGGPGYDYSVLATNTVTGCQSTQFVNVPDVRVLPVITLAVTDNGICNPVLTSPAKPFSGKVTATVTNQIGALTDYTFAFGGGNTFPPVAIANANVYDQLNGGPVAYTATTTHTVTGCVSSEVTAVVNNVQDLPDLTTQVTASTNCAPGLENGVAEVLTVDGTAVGVATGYTYAWTGPVAPAFPVGGANNASTAQLIDVQGGAGYDYTVLVTNQANGCQTSLPVNVPDAKVLPVITLATGDNGICDPALTSPAVQYNGSVTATVTNQIGALTDYTFAFGAGMNAGVTALNVYSQLNGGATAYTATATHTPTGCVSSQVTAVVNNVQDLPDLTTQVTASTNCAPGL